PRSNEARTEKRRNPPGGGSFWPRLRCSLLTDPEGYARRSGLVWAKNPSPQTWSYLWNGILRQAALPRRTTAAGYWPGCALGTGARPPGSLVPISELAVQTSHYLERRTNCY